MKILSTIFNTIFILLLLGVAGLFLAPLLPIQNNIQIKIVESGSMEPAILTGSLVVVKPSSAYAVGDVITFESRSAEVPTTHRIVSIEGEGTERVFTTKGDANEEADTDTTSLSAVLGKIVIAVPYAGFVLDFARQPMGFLLLIVLPALMIIFGEIEKIWTEVRRKKNNTHQDKDDDAGGNDPLLTEDIKPAVFMIEIGHPIVIEPRVLVRHLPVITVSQKRNATGRFGEVIAAVLITFMSLGFTSLSLIGSTVSYFNDIESSSLNTFTAQLLDFNVLADDNTYNFVANELDDEDGAVIVEVTTQEGSTGVHYEVTTSIEAGSIPFCESILADTSVPALYNGPLVNLSATDVLFDQPWVLTLTLGEESGPFTPGELCEIDIIYTAWNAEGESGLGYFDEERVSLMFFAPVEVPLAPLMFSAPDESLETELEEEEIIEEPTVTEPEATLPPVEPEEIEELQTEPEEELETQEPAEEIEEEQPEVEQEDVEEEIV